MYSLLSKQSSSEANSCQALFLLAEHRVVISYPLLGVVKMAGVDKLGVVAEEEKTGKPVPGSVKK